MGLRKSMTAMMVVSSFVFSNSAMAQVEAAEIYCTIRDTGASLNCQWVGKDKRKSMSADDIMQFIDKAEVAAYLSVKSRRGHERVFFVDAESPQFRKLSETKKTGSISEISKAKNDLFNEIEKKTIKVSDDLDAMNPTMELIKYDASVAVDKYKRELRRVDNELVTLREGSTANKAYDMGSSSIQNAAAEQEAISDRKWDAYAGLGTTGALIYGSAIQGANLNSSATTSLFLGYRRAWSEKWHASVDFRHILAGDWGSGVASTKALGKPFTYLTFSNYYSVSANWAASISVAASDFVLYRTVGGTGYQIDGAPFVGIGGKYTNVFGSWIFKAEYKYSGIAGTTFNGRTPNTGTLHDVDLTFEKVFSQKHRLVTELSFEQTNISWASNVVTLARNRDQSTVATGLGISYKYAAF